VLRKITIDQLKVGMYVESVDKSWLDVPFFRRKITSEEQIEKLRKYYINEVNIDTDRGVDLARDQSETVVAVMEEPLPRDSGESETDQADRAKIVPAKYEEEIPVAKQAYTQAITSVSEFLREARAGRMTSEQEMKDVVSGLVDSCMRNDDALISLTKLLSHDEYTFGHSVNVTIFTLALAKALGLEHSQLQELGESTLVHDVGKMLIPTELLNKPGKLTPEEFEVVKQHADLGAKFLRENFPAHESLALVAQDHHERLDGSGYPFGKSGDEISQWGQIAMIADVYDALTSDRCYKAGVPPAQAVALIYRLSEEFNPLYVERFIECVGIYPIGSLVRLNNGDVGLVSRTHHDDLLRPDVSVIYQGGRRLKRPRLVSLNETDEAGDHRLKIVDILQPDAFGVDPARQLLGA
jgi:HD-GYP domain-containing protein (c-di-GMP phosphodiesterase class II)